MCSVTASESGAARPHTSHAVAINVGASCACCIVSEENAEVEEGTGSAKHAILLPILKGH